jgi:hypothetical protein
MNLIKKSPLFLCFKKAKILKRDEYLIVTFSGNEVRSWDLWYSQIMPIPFALRIEILFSTSQKCQKIVGCQALFIVLLYPPYSVKYTSSSKNLLSFPANVWEPVVCNVCHAFYVLQVFMHMNNYFISEQILFQVQETDLARGRPVILFIFGFGVWWWLEHNVSHVLVLTYLSSIQLSLVDDGELAKARATFRSYPSSIEFRCS